MTVKELIETLLDHDPDATVVLDAFDCNGYTPNVNVHKLSLVPHPRPDSYGAGEYDGAIEPSEHQAIVIRVF